VKAHELQAAVVILLLLLALSAIKQGGYQASAAEENYLRLETPKALYLIHQSLVDSYGQETFSRLLNLVDERFDKIMNITGWSSERFYRHKLEVTVDPLKYPIYEDNPMEGFGADGRVYIQIRTGFISTNATLNTVDGFPSWVINGFLHEMIHGITPSTILNRRWLCEGYACFLSMEVQVSFGDITRNEANDRYQRSWEPYVRDGFLDFHFSGNRTIQDGWGYFITAWMLNNITETYGWESHERFFKLLPDEYLEFMPSFVYSRSENCTYNYCFDSLIVGYYSLAAGTNLFPDFKSWGFRFLPNPITTICLNGTRAQNHAFTSGVTVSLSGMGENSIDRIDYSFDRKTWNTYAEPFLVSENRILYYRSTDIKGNTGPITSIGLRVDSNSPTQPQPEPFPIILVAAALVSMAGVCASLLWYFKKKHRRATDIYSCLLS